MQILQNKLVNVSELVEIFCDKCRKSCGIEWLNYIHVIIPNKDKYKKPIFYDFCRECYNIIFDYINKLTV